MITDIILIDIQKAFDTVDQDAFLQQFYAIGFSKHTVNWFQSYLYNRSFLDNLENNCSQPASVSCDVPQVLFWGQSCLYYMPMTCHKLPDAIFFSMPMTHVLFVKINQFNEDFL